MRNRDLRKASCSCHISDPQFVVVIAVAVHEDDSNSPETLIPRGLQAILRRNFIERCNNLPARTDPLLDFHYV